MEAVHYQDTGAVPVNSRLLLPHLPVHLIDPTDENRYRSEQFIANRFKQSYQAELKHFLPYILVAQREDNIQATVGFQPGGMAKKMFIEHYCKQPVEIELTRLTGMPVTRDKIVEVGNLAGNPGGTSLTLFVVLIELLHRAGYEWLIFTATSKLRKMLAKLGLNWLTLVAANEHNLPLHHQGWGSYYHNDPLVLAASLSQISELVQQQKVVPCLLASYQGVIRSYLAGRSS